MFLDISGKKVEIKYKSVKKGHKIWPSRYNSIKKRTKI